MGILLIFTEQCGSQYHNTNIVNGSLLIGSSIHIIHRNSLGQQLHGQVIALHKLWVDEETCCSEIEQDRDCIDLTSVSGLSHDIQIEQSLTGSCYTGTTLWDLDLTCESHQHPLH